MWLNCALMGRYEEEDEQERAAFDFAFERPSFRLGKQRGGMIGSRRRGGNHCCMGRCCMCSWDSGHKSRSKVMKIQAGDRNVLVLDVYPDGTLDTF